MIFQRLSQLAWRHRAWSWSNKTYDRIVKQIVKVYDMESFA